MRLLKIRWDLETGGGDELLKMSWGRTGYWVDKGGWLGRRQLGIKYSSASADLASPPSSKICHFWILDRDATLACFAILCTVRPGKSIVVGKSLCSFEE
jgi:hypothetical protein